MAKMTKAQARRRVKEIHAKMDKLFQTGYLTMANYEKGTKMLESILRKAR